MEMNENISLLNLVNRGGVFYNILGVNKNDFMSNLINALPEAVLSFGKRSELLQAVMERETLMSTGIENGIALPHPRTPLLHEGEQPFVAMAFPRHPLDWGTPDNKPVHTLFLIVSDSQKQHLDALTKINFICMDENFYKLISSQADKEIIIAAIEEAEKDWRKQSLN